MFSRAGPPKLPPSSGSIRQHPGAYISINLSSFDIHDEHIVEQLRRLVESPGMAAENLIAEVTEHSFLDPKHASGNIAAIRALGIRVAIDDFGTGFSSISHLTTLKTDYLKIDKVFIESIGTESATSEVARSCRDCRRRGTQAASRLSAWTWRDLCARLVVRRGATDGGAPA